MLQLLDTNTIWAAIKRVRQDIVFSKTCPQERDPFYEEKDVFANVETVENVLKIESSDHNFENMTYSSLKVAAEMFLYLNTCPSHFKPWFLFYKNLFKNKTPDEIILTLNRILKATKGPKKSQFKVVAEIAQKLFKRSEDLLSLNYKKIQSFIKGNSSWDGGNYKLTYIFHVMDLHN